MGGLAQAVGVVYGAESVRFNGSKPKTASTYVLPTPGKTYVDAENRIGMGSHEKGPPFGDPFSHNP